MQAKDIRKLGRGAVIAVKTKQRTMQRAILMDTTTDWVKPTYWDSRHNGATIRPLDSSRDKGEGFPVMIESRNHTASDWRPAVLTGRDIHGTWDDHLAAQETENKRRAEKRERLASLQRADNEWAGRVLARLDHIGVAARLDKSYRTVTFRGGDVERILKLAELGANWQED